MKRQHCRYQNGFNFRNTIQHSNDMELTIHGSTYDPVSVNDTSPQFRSENQSKKYRHSNRHNAEFQ